MTRIAVLGSSTYWGPMIITDIISVFKSQIEFRLIDIDPKALELCKVWGNAANKHHGRKDVYLTFDDRKEGLKGADAVLITISTGGLDAMKYDVEIPEKYGIFATVGDTAGPSGWSRSIRNIPVFAKFAEDFGKYCPKAFIASYTNPMSSLTATIQNCCSNPTVGLCHSYHQTKSLIKEIFKLPTWDDISVEIAGMNHFHWIVNFNVGRKNGYELLKKKIGKGTIRDLLPKNEFDEHGKLSIYYGKELFSQLYETFGHIPYAGDRHTAEFLSFTLSNFPERVKEDNRKGDFYDTIKYCRIFRTEHRHRVSYIKDREKNIKDMASGKAPMPKRSTETAAEMIRAYIENKPFTDAVNHLNVGQIPGLPSDACVETLGLIDGLGVHPCMVPNIPEHLLELMRPQAVCQSWIVEGVLKRKKDLLLQALYRDPQCAGMKPHEIRAMAEDLLESNRKYFQV